MRKKQYKNKKEDDFIDSLTEFNELENENSNMGDDDMDDTSDIPLLDSYEKDSIDDEDDLSLDDEMEEENDQDSIKNKTKPKINKEKFYVDPQKFDEEILKFYESGVMSNELATMVNNIATKLSFAGNFINYSYKNDMIGDAIVRMIKALVTKKYNRSKGTNPFSYFTRIAFNSFRNRIKREKHTHETHERYREELELISENHNMVNCKNKNGNNKFKNY
jgi:hypothetical protein